MTMPTDHDRPEGCNTSANPSFDEVSPPERRMVLTLSLGAAASALFAPWVTGCAAPPATGGSVPSKLGFKGIAASTADAVVVPDGYTAQALAPWGEPVGLAGNMPAWKSDASNTAAEQAAQMGMHHDGLHFYALDGSSTRGVIACNHEYTDDGLLHPDGMKTWSAEKVKKAQAAVGVSIYEVELKGERWQMVRPSRYARRITPNTPHDVTGPAAGHPLLRTAADPSGRRVLGTGANCGAGRTPWGTYLSGEEFWVNYFAGGDFPTADQRRWNITKGGWYRWPEHDERFDARKHPNEFHRWGWIVEIDPLDPDSTPVKRTAIGRGFHEGAWVATTKEGRAVVYTGEDLRFEYIYKFVSRDRIAPAGGGKTLAQANRNLLDHGTLYVARFDADGTGRWLPLAHGQGPLVPANGFADAGEVAIKTRQAADLLGATKMDRPEWFAIDQPGGQVYCALTNNAERGTSGKPDVDAANPRARNEMGQIIRWKEDVDFDATSFRWDHLLLAGDPANERAEAKGNVRGDAFSSPDTLAIDARGVLWIGTDISARLQNNGEMARLGNNQMLACDPATGDVRRFLVGPTGCELTGCTFTPDGRTMFVNIQHPGETPSERSDPTLPQRFSTWPDGHGGGRPRSATVAIRRRDGGVIGS